MTATLVSSTNQSSPPLPLAGFCVGTTTGNHATTAASRPRINEAPDPFRCYPFALIRWTSDRVGDECRSSNKVSDDIETSWIVVRLLTSCSGLDVANDSIPVTVRFRPSITLHVTPPNTDNDTDATMSMMALDSSLIRKVYQLTPAQMNDSIPVYSARLRLNASIESPLSAKVLSSPHSPCWMAILERVPLPAVAVVLTHPNNHDDALSPLWQACLKRQLVGCPVLWRTNDSYSSRSNGIASMLTTRLHVTFEGHSWMLTVESLTTASSVTMTSTPHSPCQRLLLGDSVVVAMILPSTRITLLPCSKTTSTETINPPLSSHAPSTTTLSPTAQVLVDTIHCMRHIRNCEAGISITQPKEFIQSDIPRAFLLSGPPGVGKTHAVRMAVATAQECHLVVVQGAELVGMTGEAEVELERIWINAVTQTKTVLQRDSSSGRFGNTSSGMDKHDSSVAVIFLDECDALFASNTEHLGTTSLMVATVSRLLDRLNSDPLWKQVLVIAATNRVDALPACLRRPGRFDREIPIAPPNAAERLSLLRALMQLLIQDAAMPLDSTTKDNNTNTGEDQLTEIANATVGYVAADLSALVRRAWLLRCLDPTANVEVVDLLAQAMSDVGASALRDAALHRAKVPGSSATLSTDISPWDSIAGDPGGAKTALRQAVEWPRTKHRTYQKLGLTPPRGILLHGPPGCAKTTLARAVAAASSGVAFLSLSPADVYSSSYVGEAEAVVRRAFALARSAAPSVLFFDEIDSILGSEDNNNCSGLGRSTSTNAETRVLSTFLNEMDGIDGSLKDGVLVLGATNRPGTLDAALLRPGRFDKIIYVPPPDFQGRRSILSSQCKQWPCSVDVDRFADHSISGAMTGAEIVGACREAALRWFRDVPSLPSSPSSQSPLSCTNGILLEAYLEAALRKVKPLLSDAATLAEYTIFDERRRSDH